MLFQEDFESGLSANNWSVWNNDDAPAQVIGIDNGTYYSYRDVATGNGGGSMIYTNTSIAISGDTWVSFDGNPIFRNVGDGCGWTCAEFPVVVELFMQNGSGDNQRLKMALNYGSAVEDKTVVQTSTSTDATGYTFTDGYVLKQVAQSVTQDAFTTVSFNVADFFSDATVINQVSVRSLGWDYEGRVDNLVIMAGAPVPLVGVLPLFALGGLLLRARSAHAPPRGRGACMGTERRERVTLKPTGAA
ncbi:MAG: hypothetical protein ACPGU7_07295 [Gammaproteobacteria bacterium]